MLFWKNKINMKLFINTREMNVEWGLKRSRLPIQYPWNILLVEWMGGDTTPIYSPIPYIHTSPPIGILSERGRYTPIKYFHPLSQSEWVSYSSPHPIKKKKPSYTHLQSERMEEFLEVSSRVTLPSSLPLPASPPRIDTRPPECLHRGRIKLDDRRPTRAVDP